MFLIISITFNNLCINLNGHDFLLHCFHLSFVRKRMAWNCACKIIRMRVKKCYTIGLRMLLFLFTKVWHNKSCVLRTCESYRELKTEQSRKWDRTMWKSCERVSEQICFRYPLRFRGNISFHKALGNDGFLRCTGKVIIVYWEGERFKRKVPAHFSLSARILGFNWNRISRRDLKFCLLRIALCSSFFFLQRRKSW